MGTRRDRAELEARRLQGARLLRQGVKCQTALNRDPGSACKGTPFGGEERQRSPPAELVRVAQPGRAWWRGRGL